MLRVNQLASAFSRPVLVGVAFDSRACALLCSWFLVSQSSGTHACSILFLVIDFSFFFPPSSSFSLLLSSSFVYTRVAVKVKGAMAKVVQVRFPANRHPVVPIPSVRWRRMGGIRTLAWNR